MIQLNQPLNLDDPQAEAFLSNLQGGILKSHGRAHALHLCLRFDSAKIEQARTWIKKFAQEKVTSAQEQREAAARWRANPNLATGGELFASFLLSATGYRVLGFAEDELPGDPSGLFRNGIKAPNTHFSDPPVEKWEESYQGDVHAMIILAHNNPKTLHTNANSMRMELAGFATVYLEEGNVLHREFDGKQVVVEHFGFADGISQPILIEQDLAAYAEVQGVEQWNPSAGLDLALLEEQKGAGTYGSFMVYRKLEQDVVGFHAAIEELADRINVEPDRARALVTGRYEDGTPLIAAPTKELRNEGKQIPNNFNYVDDPEGTRCPFHAHIRRTNRRDDSGSQLRILRRGIPYGDKSKESNGIEKNLVPAADVGLLFISYQADLENFAIQQGWADANDFADQRVGVDALIGRNENPVPQKWVGQSDKIDYTMANFVEFKGGEYFFAPSISFLQTLETQRIETYSRGTTIMKFLVLARFKAESVEQLGYSSSSFQGDIEKMYAHAREMFTEEGFFDQIFGRVTGGWVGIVNVESADSLWEKISGNKTFYSLFEWHIEPIIEMNIGKVTDHDGQETFRHDDYPFSLPSFMTARSWS